MSKNVRSQSTQADQRSAKSIEQRRKVKRRFQVSASGENKKGKQQMKRRAKSEEQGKKDGRRAMEELDPRAIAYRRSGRDRRKADDPSYKGPERRLGRKRRQQLFKIIRRLERDFKS